MAFTFVAVLLFGWMAEVIGGMAAITGAFLAGLWLSRSPLRERILSAVSVPAYGIFVPIFFVDVGLTANGRMLAGESLWLFLVMVVVAVVSKVFGAGAGARLAGFSWLESLQFGVGMMSRGEVGLIVASVGISQGLISQGTFAAIVGVVIITTLLTPPLLRLLFNRPARVTGAKEGGGAEKLA
jgi:Kef-type K+ transport system membrane component KefB